MTMDDFAWMAAILAGTAGLAAFLGWRGGDSRADVALMSGSGIALGAIAGLLAAL